MKNSEVPHLTRKAIIESVDKYISQSDASVLVPVDVERIVENLGVSIIPIRDLRVRNNLESYITIGSSTMIFIDEHGYMREESRSRFTIAHELGHYVLHRSLIEKQTITNEKEYFEFINSISPDDEKSLEIQACIFAGYVLMPQASFREFVDKFIEKAGGDSKIGVYEIRVLAKSVLERYNCSTIAVEKQFRKEYPWIFDVIADAT